MIRISESGPDAPGQDMAAAWCVRLKTGGRLLADEEAALQVWLQSDPSGENALADCLKTWDTLDAIADAPEMVGFRAEALDGLHRTNRRRGRRSAWPPRLAYAIILAATGIVGLGIVNAEHGAIQNVSTDRGERRTVVLADGSRVSLDARSRVTVSLSGSQRRLTLAEGRAKFDVAHDPNRPFTVRIGKHIVIATGTSFSTELLNGKLHVILYEGRVAIADGKMPDPQALLSLRAHPKDRAIALSPGQEFLGDADRAGGMVRSESARSLSWEHGLLDFIDEPLSDAVAQLNRYSDDTITVRDPKAAAIKVNGVFEAGRSRPFLTALADLYPVTVRRRGEHQFDITM